MSNVVTVPIHEPGSGEPPAAVAPWASLGCPGAAGARLARVCGSLRDYAVTADENGQCQAAAASYEAALLFDPEDVEARVNLAVLYWQALRASLPREFREHARRRLRCLLEAAEERFAGSTELRFWARYIASTESGDAFAPDECRQLLREHPDYLDPAFVVFLNSAGSEAEPEAMRLLADYSEHRTARGRYITSVIHAVMQRRRWRPQRTRMA